METKGIYRVGPGKQDGDGTARAEERLCRLPSVDALDEASRNEEEENRVSAQKTRVEGGGRSVNMEDRMKETRGRMCSRRISRKVPPTRYKF